ncbi:hypothetical protein M728_002396 [Ensifer sp. WSM1721]|nr:hypothetical protein [Ensifer sp. WSM1721]
MLSLIVVSLFVQNQFALAGDLHPVDRALVGNEDLVIAKEKIVTLDDPLRSVDRACRLRGSLSIGFVRCHGFGQLASRKRGVSLAFLPPIPFSILTSLLIFL